jgi:hypothetical protein
MIEESQQANSFIQEEEKGLGLRLLTLRRG